MPEDQIFCPTCDEEADYAVIKSGRENLVRCAICGTVHPIQKERELLANVTIIVNRDGVSQPYHMNLPTQTELKVGAELLVDDQAKDVVLTQITSLETDRRVENALAIEVKTVWARAIDEVTLKVSVYKNGVTRPLNFHASGDAVFQRGEVLIVEGIRFQITKIKLREEGFADNAEAKDIVRIWGREL
jgi:uncharacterized Zn finger protein